MQKRLRAEFFLVVLRLLHGLIKARALHPFLDVMIVTADTQRFDSVMH